jgi:hypothetical protein
VTFTPTEEQDEIIGLFAAGDGMAVEAGAGTGKTTALRLIGESTRKRGSYVAFNRAIVDEAKAKMPRTVGCFTAHGLAFRQVGRAYQHRLNGPRLRSSMLAKALRIDPHVIRYGSQTKVLQPSFLAGHVMRAVTTFCNTADERIGRRHLAYIDGIDLPTGKGERTYGNNNDVAALLEPALHRAWADLTNRNGTLPFSHDVYLKIWQLGTPLIPGEFVLFDECQPPWSMVDMAAGGRKRIADVKVGDRVVSYT